MVLTITPDSRPLTIGADTPGIWEIFNGKIDDVRIYNRALTDSDIAELYGSPSAVAGSTPSFSLGYAIPNPAGGESHVEFTLASAQHVQIDVYDVAGRRVRSLEAGMRPAGPHVASWDGRAENGREAPSGVYFFRLQSDGRTLTSRLVLVR